MKKNALNVSILLFIIIFLIIHTIKPSLVYDEEGNYREFGVGYRHKTIIPIWLVAIITAIFTYIFVKTIFVNI
jgi:uncharacterized membrane protein YozB (DUF420 family)